MRPLVVTTFAIALMASLSAPASPSDTDRPLDPASNQNWKLTDVPAGQMLTIRLETGAGLRITTWDRNEVQVVSDLDDRHCPDARITLTRTSDGARLESDYPDSEDDVHHCSLQIDVRVPKKFDIRLRSAGGSVRIRDLEGTVTGFTGGGKLSLSQMRGEVRLRTGGGAIQVSDSDLEGSLSTGGGGITFDNVSGPVTATSGSKPGVVRGRTRTT